MPDRLQGRGEIKVGMMSRIVARTTKFYLHRPGDVPSIGKQPVQHSLAVTGAALHAVDQVLFPQKLLRATEDLRMARQTLGCQTLLLMQGPYCAAVGLLLP